MTDIRRVLVTGSNGQLGYELQRSSPDNVEIIATDVNELDITRSELVFDFIREYRPTHIINAAAYTSVDKAEEERDLAFRINQQGAANLAIAAKKNQQRMLHVSTDFVFSDSQCSPYLPFDPPKPCGVYGESKLAGENEVLSILGSQGLVVRTSWLYSAHGNNFVKTMLRLMNERDELGIVADQIGTPTWAATLADTIWQLLGDNEAHGILHCGDNGSASWYDFSVAIHELGLEKGLLQKPIIIKPIRTEDYTTPATRPAYSILDKTKTEEFLNGTLPYWRNSLGNMLDELKKNIQE